MILIGIEDCSACNIAKAFLPEVEYIQIKKKSGIDSRMLKLKKALTILNTEKKFPVVINDDMSKYIPTDVLMKNLNCDKLNSLLL